MGAMTIMSIVLHCKLSAHQPNVHFKTLYFCYYFICHKVIFCGKIYHRETRLSIVNCINTLYSRVNPYRNELRYWSPSGQYCVGVHLGWVYWCTMYICSNNFKVAFCNLYRIRRPSIILYVRVLIVI